MEKHKEESEAIIKFGLEQQGHIPTIERMLDDLGSSEYSWKKIGDAIGWCPQTACIWYARYLRNKIKDMEGRNRNCEHTSVSSWGRLATCLNCGYEWIKDE